MARVVFHDETLGFVHNGVRRLSINLPSGDIDTAIQVIENAPATQWSTSFINFPMVDPPPPPEPSVEASTGEEKRLFQIERDGWVRVLPEGEGCVWLLRASASQAEPVPVGTWTRLDDGDVCLNQGNLTFDTLDDAEWVIRLDVEREADLFMLPSVRVCASLPSPQYSHDALSFAALHPKCCACLVA